MNDDQLTTLRAVGASLKHIGSAMLESFNHAGHHGSKTPLQPLDVCFAAELSNLRRRGLGQIADALEAFRTEMGDSDNG
jgi:hypothetical protein